jgi:putative ABC transport system permease protein
VVVGAKGSPLQLILAGVFHIDVPPGNIPLAEVQALAKHPQVAQLIPLSLGDSFPRLSHRRHHAGYIPLPGARWRRARSGARRCRRWWGRRWRLARA